MTFDVVMGNPPYTNNIDLEFAKEALNNLQTSYFSFVHPAKWKSMVNDKNANIIQNFFLNNKHLKEIHLYECCSHNMTEIWGGKVRAGSINYYIANKNQEYEDIKVYTTMSSGNKHIRRKMTIQKHNKEIYPYFCMNPYVLSIVNTVKTSDKFKSIRYRFENKLGLNEVFIANSLFQTYTEENKTDDSKAYQFTLSERESLQNYVLTPFWRALTRNFKTGFHSISIEMFDYLPDFDFESEVITEEYIEELFNLTDEQKEFLKNYSGNITDLP